MVKIVRDLGSLIIIKFFLYITFDVIRPKIFRVLHSTENFINEFFLY